MNEVWLVSGFKIFWSELKNKQTKTKLSACFSIDGLRRCVYIDMDLHVLNSEKQQQQQQQQQQ